MPLLLRAGGLSGLLLRTNQMSARFRGGMARPIRSSLVIIRGWIKDNIAKRGALQPGGWLPLRASTIKRKMRIPGIGPARATRPLVRTGALRDGWAMEVGPRRGVLKSLVDYGGYHEHGTRKMFRRPILPDHAHAVAAVKPVWDRWLARVLHGGGEE